MENTALVDPEHFYQATYSYVANSPLVSQIDFKSNTTVRLTTTKTFDNLNRLTSIAPVGTVSTPSVNSHTYSYNDANQRTRVNMDDGSFWIYPVRYGSKVLLRLRPAVTQGRPILHRLHPRSATTPSLASKRRGRVHTGSPSGRIDLLRGVSASAGRHSAGEIFEVSLGQTLSERPPAKLSHGVNEYDKLGQVISGKRYWSDWTPVAGQQYEYAFDDTRPVRGGNWRHLRRMEMGAIAVDGDARSNISHGVNNRSSTKSGGDSAGAGLRSASYTANALNQYSSRDVPAYLNVHGIANANASVTVNSQSPYRKGEYFQKELSANNASAALWQSVTNIASLTGTNQTNTGSLFLPKTAESYTYDLDGNLTSDGRWTNQWDAENRLIDMTSHSSGPSGSRKSLQFAYDSQGRRYSKVVSNWTGSAWTRALHEKFVYDGWNLLGAMNGTNNAIIRSLLWGLDLSGSLQGAGGVGGLIAFRQHSGSLAGSHFAAYDGNGNVMALVDGKTGNASARYEYDPFGQTIRASGTMATVNPVRFSSKVVDDETDYAYYGYRYLNPNVGRWLSRDPIRDDSFKQNNVLEKNLQKAIRRMNSVTYGLYNFANNNPMDQIDFLGLETIHISVTTLIRPPDSQDGVKTIQTVSISDGGEVSGGGTFTGFTDVFGFPVQGSSTFTHSGGGTHPVFYVTATGNAESAALPSFMDIDYSFTVTVNFCSRKGRLTGKNDSYPSYVVRAVGDGIYDFQQQSLTGLIGDGDVEVDIEFDF